MKYLKKSGVLAALLVLTLVAAACAADASASVAADAAMAEARSASGIYGPGQNVCPGLNAFGDPPETWVPSGHSGLRPGMGRRSQRNLG